jgi:hypothetical protein
MPLFLCEYARAKNGRGEHGNFETVFDAPSLESVRDWIVDFGRSQGAHAVMVYAYVPKSIGRGGRREPSQHRRVWTTRIGKVNGGLQACPVCETPSIETTGQARRGGGYSRLCANGHRFDDPTFTYYG